jgi:hypothetical protein
MKRRKTTRPVLRGAAVTARYLIPEAEKVSRPRWHRARRERSSCDTAPPVLLLGFFSACVTRRMPMRSPHHDRAVSARCGPPRGPGAVGRRAYADDPAGRRDHSFGVVIPPHAGLGMEFSVAIMLVILGVLTRRASPAGFRKAWPGRPRLTRRRASRPPARPRRLRPLPRARSRARASRPRGGGDATSPARSRWAGSAPIRSCAHSSSGWCTVGVCGGRPLVLAAVRISGGRRATS